MRSQSPSSHPNGDASSRVTSSLAKRSALGGGQRPWKRRSSKACLSCRNRKVRCDVTDGGIPCTNCRLDSINCVLKESNRGRRPAAASCQRRRNFNPPAATDRSSGSPRPTLVTSRSAVAVTESLEPEEFSEPDEQDDHEAEPVNEDLRPHSQLQVNPAQIPEFDQQQQPTDGELMDEIHVQIQDDQPLNSRPLAPMESANLDAPFEYVGEIRTSIGPLPPTQPDRVTTSLPAFIRPPPQHLDDRDMYYLSHKLCLSIPDPEFRDELLRVYATVVHSFLPILDIEEYAGSILDNNGRNPISLLLFQAVNFVSVTFVDIKMLNSRGYVSRIAARRDFYDRVRLLYSLNYESDRMTLIQSLLLLSHWYDGPDDDKDTWHWMGIALTNAQVGGLHRDPQHLKISQEEKKLRRRLWWCCLMRDRLLALGIRNPPRLRDDEYNVKPLTLDDFDLSSPSTNLDMLFHRSKAAYPNSEKRKNLALMCVELSNLCVYIGRTLNTLYTVMGNYLGGVEYSQQSTTWPGRSEEQAKSLAERSTELKTWLENQNIHSQYTAKPTSRQPDINTTDDLQVDEILRLHQAHLRLVYFTALGALHRPQVFCYGPNSNGSAVSRGNVTDTAVEMTKLAFNLQRDNQLRFLPTLAVPAYLAVTLVHLFNTCSDEEEARSLSLGRLYQCVSVLQQLQEMYTSADYAMQFLNSILKNTGLHVPWTLPTGGSRFGERDGTAYKPRLDMGPSAVAASCMYPSPSTSGNWNQESAADELASGHDSNQAVAVAQEPRATFAFPNLAMESWNATDMSDLLAGSPFPGSWCDVETLLPTLLNTEGDTEGLMNVHLST
ncbi:cutinase transcription factor 1 beta [Fusarium denticulatum]|uniref:Cutinase transcription factor 1 beta n=1 Tax=Fusarium denticulatum TaxID=48507 RepID=A0A8H5TS78_9HYPO|nr:cutinase transcription factor 1 beta [Fusarium denticulatum]